MVEVLINQSRKEVIMEYFFITIGCILMALGIGVFLVEAKVVPGGASGLSMAIHYLTDGKIGVGLASWLINIPLFIWGLKELGKEFGIRTFYGFTVTSIFMDLFRGDFPGLKWFRTQDLQSIKYLYENDFFFFVLIGTVLLGVGLGIIFKFKGTTAGSDIVAAILNKKYGTKPGNGIIIIDTFVIIFASIIIGMNATPDSKPLIALICYALFLVFFSSKIIDIVIEGFDYVRAALIFSEKKDEIAEQILKKMNRGATAIKSRGLYSHKDTEIIYTVITMKEIGKLTDLVKSIDPNSFMVITMVHEVVGHGFRRRL
jgi:uncharacterized membrane-anchored protein YitT (DUF2179 family)